MVPCGHTPIVGMVYFQFCEPDLQTRRDHPGRHGVARVDVLRRVRQPGDAPGGLGADASELAQPVEEDIAGDGEIRTRERHRHWRWQ